jgi:hypothetical protein
VATGSTHVECSVLSKGLRQSADAHSRNSTHLMRGCVYAQPFVRPAGAGTHPATAEFAMAGFLEGALPRSRDGAAEPQATWREKLRQGDVAAAYASGAVVPSENSTLKQLLRWLQQNTPEDARPMAPVKATETARAQANAARRARGLSEGTWGKSPVLTPADEVMVERGLPFVLPAVEGVDLMRAEVEGAAVLQSVPRWAASTVKCLASVRSSASCRTASARCKAGLFGGEECCLPKIIKLDCRGTSMCLILALFSMDGGGHKIDTLQVRMVQVQSRQGDDCCCLASLPIDELRHRALVASAPCSWPLPTPLRPPFGMQHVACGAETTQGKAGTEVPSHAEEVRKRLPADVALLFRAAQGAGVAVDVIARAAARFRWHCHMLQG